MTSPRTWYVGEASGNDTGDEPANAAPSLVALVAIGAYRPGDKVIYLDRLPSCHRHRILFMIVGLILALVWLLLVGCSIPGKANASKAKNASDATAPKTYLLVWTPNTSSVPLSAQNFRVYSGLVPFTNRMTQWGLPIQLVDYSHLMEYTNWPCVATITSTNCYCFQATQNSQFFAVQDQWNQWATSK